MLEQESKKVHDKALQIYRAEMASVAGSASTKNVATLRKTHKQLEAELRKFVGKEMRGYSRLAEVTEKMLVRSSVMS